ncbi:MULTISPECIES: bifunctional transcriptional activator/DNA repair enzyme AdaA [unclassified Legionella]|uniref:bifunctional transcriptional activator/DNA repair enzyme AdaA n=1 Tax=unclassified Legionella TaxID=2622702 RepID=UPI001055FA0A|nr:MULTISPECIES: bifunctional transcriptional activator/DNA repair protein Ada [unclassified Legionella]MDI9819334.1 trifunctional transcriptional activator/DNA repair protein Ada/methylated-DNA--[protein]-cysteine S-methyltransferase [Legionella sp. PL877]
MNKSKHQEYYEALIAKDTNYEGIFFVGVRTTGVFCRPTCTARKPKAEHCEFFRATQEALLAGYRPCKRCRPLSHPNQATDIVRLLVEAVENNPTKRWQAADFKNLAIDESTARRQFKKRFGMTFVAYARARRIGEAMKEIRHGTSVIDTQLQAGYESGSGFRDAFSKLFGNVPKQTNKQAVILRAAWIDTALGPMIAIADDERLYLLEFVMRRGLEREVERLRSRGFAIIPGYTAPLTSIEVELKAYFEGRLKAFKTPYRLFGSPFQQQVWQALCQIPYGETRSYLDIAKFIGKQSAFRAVAQANGANQLAIIIPCHRVINENGQLGGYGGGIARKEWLINLEKTNQ